MKKQEYLEYVAKNSALVKDLGNCTDGLDGNRLELRISNHIPGELFILWIPPGDAECQLFAAPKTSGQGHIAAFNCFKDAIAKKQAGLKLAELAVGVLTCEIYVTYIPNHNMNFYFEINSSDDPGTLLDHIMKLPDGDIGNYKIYQRII